MDLPPDGVAAASLVGRVVVSVGCGPGGGLSGDSDGSVVTTLEPGYRFKNNDKIQVFSHNFVIVIVCLSFENTFFILT